MVGIYPIVITATNSSGSLPASQTFTLMVGTPEGTVYWLTSAASGGWLEMQAAGSNVTELLDTNVSKFAVDGSGGAVALEAGGNLVRFAANSTVQLSTTRGVASFLVDGSGFVWALTLTPGTDAGPLALFAPGSSTSETIPGSFTNFAEDGSGSVVALDNSKSLWLFAQDR